MLVLSVVFIVLFFVFNEDSFIYSFIVYKRLRNFTLFIP